jgi:hypothetical protein
MTTYRCVQCRIDYDIREFYIDPYSNLGHKTKCKCCYREASRERARKIASSKKTPTTAPTRFTRSIQPIEPVDKPVSGPRPEDGTAAYHLWRNARNRAAANNLPFDITIGWVEQNMPEYCPVLPHLRLERQYGKHADCSPSLDKLVPHLGYAKANNRIISMRANAIKTNATLAELVAVCDYLRREVA